MKSSADLTVFVNLNWHLRRTRAHTVLSGRPQRSHAGSIAVPKCRFYADFFKWEEASVSCCYPLAANSSVALSLTVFALQLNA